MALAMKAAPLKVLWLAYKPRHGGKNRNARWSGNIKMAPFLYCGECRPTVRSSEQQTVPSVCHASYATHESGISGPLLFCCSLRLNSLIGSPYRKRCCENMTATP